MGGLLVPVRESHVAQFKHVGGGLPPVLGNRLFAFLAVSLINIASSSYVIFFAESLVSLAAGGAVAEPDCKTIPTIDTSRKKCIGPNEKTEGNGNIEEMNGSGPGAGLERVGAWFNCRVYFNLLNLAIVKDPVQK